VRSRSTGTQAKLSSGHLPDNASIHHNNVRGGLAPWQLKRVDDYIEANLGSTIRAADLARIAQQSVSYFSRAFRRSVGYTPHAYVMRQRMRRAQDIMLSSEHPLSRIALECGMSDQAHFSRVFRKLVGTNPWAWRRQFSSGPRMEPIASGNDAADLARQF